LELPFWPPWQTHELPVWNTQWGYKGGKYFLLHGYLYGLAYMRECVCDVTYFSRGREKERALSHKHTHIHTQFCSTTTTTCCCGSTFLHTPSRIEDDCAKGRYRYLARKLIVSERVKKEKRRFWYCIAANLKKTGQILC
jgi:hypothetical protein